MSILALRGCRCVGSELCRVTKIGFRFQRHDSVWKEGESWEGESGVGAEQTGLIDSETMAKTRPESVN